MNKNIDSCSDVQQKYERIVFERVEEWLGVKLQSNPKIYFDKVHIEPDFYSSEEKIVGEIFAHVDELLTGQKRKISQDILKMLLLDSKHDCIYRKIIVICDTAALKFLNGDSWTAACISEFGIEIKYIELSEEERQELLTTQAKQFR